MAQAKSNKQFTSSDPNKGEHVVEGEDAQEAGYWGTRDNPFPDEAFALTTGPDAPITDAHGNPVDVEKLEADQKALVDKAEKADKAQQAETKTEKKA